MNNYEYYNYMNNNYNVPNYNQEKQPELYNPYNGFIRGNLFPSLYNPYKIEKPYEIKPLNEQAEMLTYIDAINFACHELNLYLDINPDDSKMIDLYNQYSLESKKLMERYQDAYGPLLVSFDEKTPWSWKSSPWPWEV